MDLLDFQIFGLIGKLGKIDPWGIAKTLGVDGKTVKLRIRRMEKQGFIKYYQVYPNYRLLGVEGLAGYLLEVSGIKEKYEAIEKISLLDRVVQIYNFVGNTFCVDFAYSDARDHDKRLSLIRELSRCSSNIKFDEIVVPPTRITFDNLDWRIIKSIRYQAFKRVSKVADELGVSLKTVRKRLERMISNKGFVIAPIINPGEVPNTITYGMLFFLEEDKMKKTVPQVLDAFRSSCFLAHTPSTGNVLLINFATTLGQTEDALLQARSIEGVTEVRQYVLKELREYSEWMDREIEKKIEGTERS